jgi:23S rRNA (cytidine1920-2'-O)/16S rRNA (cytidine1409-2'-O)-methyltransferase
VLAVRRRLDVELVRRGLVESRREAHDVVEAGRVLVGGAPALKLARMVGDDEPIVIEGPPKKYVSRGGDKLAGALDAFELDVTDMRIIDVGASTGGFTDCVLQRGAAHVVALDVGHGQLHPKLREHPDVTVIERTNIRHADLAALGGPFDLVVADLSFISLTVVAEALVTAAGPGGEMVLLIKPQFEAGKADVSRGKGVITDPELHARACADVTAALLEHGATVVGRIESPIKGGQGNVEFLVHVRVSP